MVAIKGFTQVEWIDYEEIFSPIVKFQLIRILVAMIAHHDLELHQRNIKTALLNEELEEEIYRKQTKGFMVQGHEYKV